MKNWLFLAVVAFAVGAGIGLLDLDGLRDEVRQRGSPIEVGQDAPEVLSVTLDQQPVTLSELEGKVVLLNVWATWCPPCVEEMPSMQRLYDTVGSEDFEIVAVSIDSHTGLLGSSGEVGGDVQAFVERYGLTFQVWHDPEAAIQRSYRTTGVPESFVIDRNGVIVKKVLGGHQWDSEANIDLIRRLLGDGDMAAAPGLAQPTDG